MRDIITPSIEFAERGIPNYEYMLGRLKAGKSVSQFERFPPGGLDIFFDNGSVPEPGSLLVQSALGGILRKMADKNIGHRKENRLNILRVCLPFVVINDYIEGKLRRNNFRARRLPAS